MEQINQGEVPPKTLRFSAHDLLVTTNRQTSGEGYGLLHKALLRLRGTTIETNILTNDIEMEKGFGIINEYDIIRKSRPKGRMLQIQVELVENPLGRFHSESQRAVFHNRFRK